MLKFLVLFVLVAAYGETQANECKLTKGKDLITFSKTKEQMKFGCKFNAVRDSRCGKWLVTVTPGLKLAKKGKGYVYVLDTMYIALQRRRAAAKTLNVRMSMKTVERYINGKKVSPINFKNGTLSIKRVYEYKHDGKKMVTLSEKKNDFEITYELYDNKNTQTSEMSFKCKDTFEPRPFPEQLCGNGTKREVKITKQEEGGGNRNPVILYSVFTQNIAQTDADCAAVTKTMMNNCKGMEKEATRKCFSLTYHNGYIKCLMDDQEEDKQTQPMSVFKDCVDFVCSNYTATASCNKMVNTLSDHSCKQLKGVSEKCSSG